MPVAIGLRPPRDRERTGRQLGGQRRDRPALQHPDLPVGNGPLDVLRTAEQQLAGNAKLGDASQPPIRQAGRATAGHRNRDAPKPTRRIEDDLLTLFNDLVTVDREPCTADPHRIGRYTALYYADPQPPRGVDDN